ncbi:MAG TPA: DUF1439 domain-containing protein [Ramlibacter sp.]|nr:DUF1439 domain-containing protein [Ramlibacter sp.]
MHRRTVLRAAAPLALALAAGLPLPRAVAQPHYKVSARQLQEALAQRFPLRYPVQGLVEFQMQTPRLRFLPEQNRLGSELLIDASGAALRRSHSGIVDVDFALRYEPSDQTLRAHQLRVQEVRLPTLPPDAAAFLDAYIRASAQRALLEVVLHRLQPRDLALADTMGFEPGDITVAADGLVIGFVPKQAR